MKKVISTSQAPTPIGPYSQAIEANGMLFFSGQVAIHPETGQMVQETLEKETHQVMSNIKAVLAEAGLDFSHVVKSSIFLKDLNDFDDVNEIYGSYFTNEYPARETVQVVRLPKDANVEISIIAVR